jgi:hypothetical protein
MVIGSGPIIIGQAAEFDYAGTQACQSLREEGLSVVLVNSNPSTIMTDPETADKVYIEPLNIEFAERIIAQERPDGLLPTLGGANWPQFGDGPGYPRHSEKIQRAPSRNASQGHSTGRGQGTVPEADALH